MVSRTKNKNIKHKKKRNNIFRFSAISLLVIFSFFTLPTVSNFLDKNLEKTIKSIVTNYDGLIDSILLGCTELPIVINENYFKGKKAISSIDEYIKYLL